MFNKMNYDENEINSERREYYTTSIDNISNQILLSSEDIIHLMKSIPDPSDIDILRSRCTHTINGKSAFVNTDDGSNDKTCSICMATINSNDYTTVSDIISITKDYINKLESFKVFYIEYNEDPDYLYKISEVSLLLKYYIVPIFEKCKYQKLLDE